MEILFLISGIFIGGVLGWLITRYVIGKKIQESEFDVKVLQERLSDYSIENTSMKEELQANHEQIIDLNRKLGASETTLEHLRQNLVEQKKEVNEAREKMTLEFKNLANEILEENASKFTLQNKENISEILKPLGEKIREFEKKVEDTYDKGLKDQTDLKAELKKVYELSLKLDEDAKNLSNALRSDTKKQGNWGEIVLERVLERSGLVKGAEYVTQPNLKGEQGNNLRPDVLINLPDKKSLVIDSKVSLKAYERYVNEEEQEVREKHLKQHIESVRNHVKELGEKAYQLSTDIDTPDFVLLFMPIESAFSLAIQNDTDLFGFAWDRRIVIVSPTTLLATLRTVESIWKHEKQTQNALEIARQSGALYDKFCGFLKDLDKMGGQLSALQTTYDKAYKKISTGTGNLIVRVERLKELGAKTSRELPEKLLHKNDE